MRLIQLTQLETPLTLLTRLVVKESQLMVVTIQRSIQVMVRSMLLMEIQVRIQMVPMVPKVKMTRTLAVT